MTLKYRAKLWAHDMKKIIKIFVKVLLTGALKKVNTMIKIDKKAKTAAFISFVGNIVEIYPLCNKYNFFSNQAL